MHLQSLRQGELALKGCDELPEGGGQVRLHEAEMMELNLGG